MPTYFTVPDSKPDTRPALPRSTHSFSRLDSSPARSIRSNSLRFDLDTNSVTETTESPLEVSEDEDDQTPLIPDPLPEGWDELPTELIALCDKFLESLKQRNYSAPITGEHLSNLFQNFYNNAFEHIQIHINTLYLALSSKKKKNSSGPETQMLSISEISQKKKDRRMLAAKKFALEEAVERRITGGIYDKIWRHRSTDDEARDESLRSKRETLKVVGVGLGHLGVAGVEDEDMIEALAAAREALTKMTNMSSPLAKLDLLRQCHKEIVDILCSRNSDSSADRILPTLIFCLIHCPASITVVSDLLFIQRFRMKRAIDGEAAYCLTNLEAAICFLETVDLATLKVDSPITDNQVSRPVEENEKSISSEPTEASKESTISIPAPTTSPPADPALKRPGSRGRKPVRDLVLTGNTRNRSESSSGPFVAPDDPLSNLSSKLLSAKIDHSLRVAEEAWDHEVAKTPSPRASKFPDSARQPPPKASLTPSSSSGGGSEVVRNRALSYLTKNPVVDVAESVVMGADAGFKTIGDALGGSYKFLFGRMDEKKQEMPKTLDDARKLVEQPATPGVIAPMEEGTSDIWGMNPPLPSPSPPPLPLRPGEKDREKDRILQSASPVAAFAAVGTGLSRVVGMGSGVVMRGFARSNSNLSLDKEKDKALAERAMTTTTNNAVGSVTLVPAVIGVGKPEPLSPPPPMSDLLSTFPELASPLLRSSKEANPGAVPTAHERFMQVTEVGELKVSELQELLEEYKKLANFVSGLRQT